MILGLLSKSMRETWLAIVLFGLGLLIFEFLLVFIFPQVQGMLDEVLAQMPFARTMIAAMLGANLEEGVTAQILQAFHWVHPVVLALVWGHEIMFCTRLPAGEIDRGTIDILLGLPVSRRAVFLVESAMWLASGAFILAMGLVGYGLGTLVVGPEAPPPVGHVLLVVLNLFGMYVAVGGLAYLCSAVSDRRARAIGTVFGLVLASFLLNFLAQYWEPARQVSFLSVLKYYRPAVVLSEGHVPWRDLAVLLGVGAVAWVTAGEIIVRRSVCTV